MKIYGSASDKGMAFVKVKSLDQPLCERLQKVRSRYILATSECYYNSPEDIRNIASFSKYFDFHIVSCKRIGEAIKRHAPSSRYVILGAGEFLTDSNIFKVENAGLRPLDFIASANSFWAVKNFHKMLEMQYHLKNSGHQTSSKIICGSVKDKSYLKQCQSFIDKNIPGQSEIIIGTSIEDIKRQYNASRFLVHMSSIDSSPRVVFEALLCGCRCILSGRWTESLNDWLKEPTIHLVGDGQYHKAESLLKLAPDLSLAKQYRKKIGLTNVFPKISSFIRKEIESSFSDKNVIEQSCVGKTTFKSTEDRYTLEISNLRNML